MRKKLVFVIIAVILIAFITMLILSIRKSGFSLAAAKNPGVSSSSLVSRAKDQEAGGSLEGAKAAYQKLIAEFPNSKDMLNWQKKLEELNIKLLFSSTITAGSALYAIKPGDTLNKIAKEFNTTVELIKKSNNLSSDNIVPGRKIKVWTSPFAILVDKSQNILILKNDEEVFKTYIVATGVNNSTPVGNFKITNKLPNPTWYKAGAVVPPSSPENVLGSRWLGIDQPGYGIHGTIEPQTLGIQVTQGCVRMNNADVEELYAIVPVGSAVTIVD